MKIETNLVIAIIVGYAVIYTLKRLFNVIDYKIKNNLDVKKEQVELESDKVVKDLDKKLSSGPWR